MAGIRREYQAGGDGVMGQPKTPVIPNSPRAKETPSERYLRQIRNMVGLALWVWIACAVIVDLVVIVH
jgi:hypothetical protein